MNTKAGNSTKTICPIAKTAELLSDVWTILIIRELILSNMRFCELEKKLSGISTRTLTIKLSKLIREDLVKKNDMSYFLTKKGRKLSLIFDAMAIYGKRYMK